MRARGGLPFGFLRLGRKNEPADTSASLARPSFLFVRPRLFRLPLTLLSPQSPSSAIRRSLKRIIVRGIKLFPSVSVRPPPALRLHPHSFFFPDLESSSVVRPIPPIARSLPPHWAFLRSTLLKAGYVIIISDIVLKFLCGRE